MNCLGRIGAFLWFWRHLSPLCQQFWDTDEVVADQIEQKVGGHSGQTPVFRLTHGAVLLAPSEQTLDHFAFALRENVGRVPGGSSIDGRLARRSSLRDLRVDGDVRGAVLRPQARHVFSHIIGLVCADRDAGMRRGFLRQHVLRGRAFGRPARLRDQPRNGEAVPVVHRGMAHVAEFTLRALALAVEAAVGIGRACMRGVLASRAGEVLPVTVCLILWFEAFLAGPRFDQCAVDGELLVRQQGRDLFMMQQRVHEAIEQIAVLQALTILRKRRGIPHRVVRRKPDKPAVQQIVVQLFHQLPLTPYAVKHLQEQCAQQLFGRDRRTPRR